MAASVDTSLSRLVYLQHPESIPPTEHTLVQQTPVPAAPTTPQPLTPEQARVEAALAQLEAAQDAKAAVPNSTDHPYLQEDIDAARQNLKAAIDAELQARAAQLPQGQTPDAKTLKQWTDDILARYANNPARQAAVREAVGQVGTARETLKETPKLQQTSQGDIARQVKAFNEAYAKAPPSVQQQMMADPATRELIESAAAWANEPLKNGANPESTAQSLERLNWLTQNTPKELAGEIVKQALPAYEKAGASYTGATYNHVGIQHLMHISDRIAGTAAGDEAVRRFAATGAYDEDGVRVAMAEGARPVYLIEYLKQHKDAVDVPRALDNARRGMEMFRDGVLAKDIDAHAKATEELSWLIRNYSPSMNETQLAQAIKDYVAAHPDFEKKIGDLQNKIAEDGQRLLNQAALMGDLPPELAEHQGRIDKQMLDIIESPQAEYAATLALKKYPDIVDPKNVGMLKLFGTMKASERGVRLVGEFVNAYMQTNVAKTLTNMNPNSPQSVAQASESLNKLKVPGMAKVLGIEPKKIDEAIEMVRQTFPANGQPLSKADIEAKLTKLHQDLNGVKGFQDGTLAGKAFRFLGVAGAASSFLGSVTRSNSDPATANDIKEMCDLVGLTRAGAEFAKAMGVSGGATKALAAKGATGWAFAAVSAVGDLALAYDSAVNNKDYVGGALYTVSAAGGILAAAGSLVTGASILGPIGIGLVLAAGVSGVIWADTKAGNKFDGNLTQDAYSDEFLAHSKLDAESVKVLVDQSGDWHSPVPLLMKYGQVCGLSPAQTVEWLNGLSREQLIQVRDIAHQTLDYLDGDVSRFDLKAANDEGFASGPQLDQPRPDTAISASQFSSLLTSAGIPTPDPKVDPHARTGGV